MNPLLRALVVPVTLLAVAASASGCSGDAQAGGPAVTTLHVWRHTGTPAELTTLEAQVRVFNASHPTVHAVLTTVAEGSYNDRLQVAATSGTMPDVVEMDGPNLANYVYQHRLVPLDDLVDATALADQLPSARSQDTLGGHRYAVSVIESGLGIYADRRALRRAGVRVPADAAHAWTGAEFVQVLRRLAAHDPDGKVLDVKRDYGVGEWLTYGFAPLVSSAGGSLIDPVTLHARGHLDGTGARTALRALRSWAPYVDQDVKGDAFTSGRVPLSWVGHWAYPDYAKALGGNLVVVPLPDLGDGSKSGQGSWTWAVGATPAHRAAAGQFLDFLLQRDQVLTMTDADGAVPATRAALERSRLYRPGGPLRLFAEQLLHSCGGGVPTRACVSVPRPLTPGYPMLSAQFATAVDVALSGHDPQPALTKAAAEVDRDLRANHGYR